MPTALPTINEYQEALQHPEKRFKDERLKSSRVETDPMGMPRVRSGGFALTYCLNNGNKQFAVRCFHKISLDRDKRYAAISRFLSTCRTDIFIPVEYVSQGILIRGNWYPITIMDWVDGITLENYIYQNINKPAMISFLPAEFCRVVSEVERLKVAHGDLSHLNIIIKNKKMVFIDYDGMFVPELSSLKSAELGNPHFQHPGRSDKNFDSQLDRFSSIVIYLTLQGLTLAPHLYQEYGKGGENLLLKREDFIQPYNSKLLKCLEKIPELTTFVQQFCLVCLSDVGNVPSLADLIENRPINVPRSEAIIPQRVHAYPVFNSSNLGALIENEGEYITVIGKVDEVKRDKTRYGSPYVFLNLGNWRENCFTVVMWSEVLNMLIDSRSDPRDYDGKWISVTGLLSIYTNRFGSRPQIVLNSPAQIEVLSEMDAHDRLTGKLERLNDPHVNQLSNNQDFINPSLQSDLPKVTPTAPKSGKIDSPVEKITQLYSHPDAPLFRIVPNGHLVDKRSQQILKEVPTQNVKTPGSNQNKLSNLLPKGPGLETNISNEMNNLYAKKPSEPKQKEGKTAINASNAPQLLGEKKEKRPLWRHFNNKVKNFWNRYFNKSIK